MMPCSRLDLLVRTLFDLPLLDFEAGRRDVSRTASPASRIPSVGSVDASLVASDFENHLVKGEFMRHPKKSSAGDVPSGDAEHGV